MIDCAPGQQVDPGRTLDENLVHRTLGCKQVTDVTFVIRPEQCINVCAGKIGIDHVHFTPAVTQCHCKTGSDRSPTCAALTTCNGEDGRRSPSSHSAILSLRRGTI
jgi:hypothetical protein